LLTRLPAGWAWTSAGDDTFIDGRSGRIRATGATISAILLALTGGLALVVRSLKDTDLNLSLTLQRSPEADDEQSGPEHQGVLPHNLGRGR
jgi:hypothetical protein